MKNVFVELLYSPSVAKEDVEDLVLAVAEAVALEDVPEWFRDTTELPLDALVEQAQDYLEGVG